MPRAKKRNILSDIHSLQLVRALVLATAGLALAVLLYETKIPVDVSYITKDILGSQSSTVFAPAMKTVWDMSLAVVSIPLFVSAGFALYAATRGEYSYHRELKNAQSPLRWLEFGISWALIIEVIALLAGVNNIVTLKLLAGFVIMASVLGWLADKQNQKTKKPDFTAFYTSVFSIALPWVVIASSLMLSWFYGAVRMPWYSYTLPLLGLTGLVLVMLNQMLGYKRRNNWKDYRYVECNMVGIDMILKAIFASLLILSFKG